MKIHHDKCSADQQFPKVTCIGSLPSKNPSKRDPCKNLQSPAERPRRGLGEPSERQMSSENLWEGCAPRMVTLLIFRTVLRFVTLVQNSLDRGQSRKNKFSKLPGSGAEENLVNSVFCCFSWEKLRKCSPKASLANQFLATPWGHLNRTGPIQS